jgi:hypothetical protein
VDVVLNVDFLSDQGVPFGFEQQVAWPLGFEHGPLAFAELIIAMNHIKESGVLDIHLGHKCTFPTHIHISHHVINFKDRLSNPCLFSLAYKLGHHFFFQHIKDQLDHEEDFMVAEKGMIFVVVLDELLIDVRESFLD